MIKRTVEELVKLAHLLQPRVGILSPGNLTSQFYLKITSRNPTIVLRV